MSGKQAKASAKLSLRARSDVPVASYGVGTSPPDAWLQSINATMVSVALNAVTETRQALPYQGS